MTGSRRTRSGPQNQSVSKRADRAVDAETFRAWRRVVVDLQAVPDPEPDSVLKQLLRARALPDGFLTALRFLNRQGAACLCAGLNVRDCGLCDADLTPIAPLARSALLAFAKIVAVCAPLCLEVRQVGAARQLWHDNLVNVFVDHERRIEMDFPDGRGASGTAGESASWVDRGRDGLLSDINSLRDAFGMKPIEPGRGVKPGDILVNEGSWIWDAQRKSASVRDLVNAPDGGFERRMQWVWHSASTITHGGMSTFSSTDQKAMLASYLGPVDASAMLGMAVEMGVSAHRLLMGVSLQAASPPQFRFNNEGRLPKAAPK